MRGKSNAGHDQRPDDVPENWGIIVFSGPLSSAAALQWTHSAPYAARNAWMAAP